MFPPPPGLEPWFLVAGVAGALAGVVLFLGAITIRDEAPPRPSMRAGPAPLDDMLFGHLKDDVLSDRPADRDWRSGDLPPFSDWTDAPAAAPDFAAPPEPAAEAVNDQVNERAEDPAVSASPTPAGTAGEADPRAFYPHPAPLQEVLPREGEEGDAASGHVGADADAEDATFEDIDETPLDIEPRHIATFFPDEAVTTPDADEDDYDDPGADILEDEDFEGPPLSEEDDPEPVRRPPLFARPTPPVAAPAPVSTRFTNVRDAIDTARLEEAERLFWIERARVFEDAMGLAELTGLAGDRAVAAGRPSEAKWLWRLALQRFAEAGAISDPAAREVSERLRLADR
ncbi:MAG: hypothetical protein R3C52_07220 [Hyphomonadaceae bacterium]